MGRMSTQKDTQFDFFINRVCKVAGVKPAIVRAASLLGLSRQGLQNHKLRGTYPEKQAYSFAYASNVSPEWLLYGEGSKEAPQYTAKGNAIIDAVIKEFDNPDRILPMSDIARVMGINPDKPSQRLEMGEIFPSAIHLLTQIFIEGDKIKLSAIMAQLMAFNPPLSDEKLLEKFKKKLEEASEEEPLKKAGNR